MNPPHQIHLHPESCRAGGQDTGFLIPYFWERGTDCLDGGAATLGTHLASSMGVRNLLSLT